MAQRKDPEIAAEWIRGAFGWIVITLVAILVIPTAIVVGIGFAQGTIPSPDAGGIFGAGPGYPAFAPPFWLLWVPAIGALALSVATWRYAGQFMDSIFSARWDLGTVSLFGASVTLAASVTFGAPFLGLVLGAVAPWVLALLVILSRGLWDGVSEAVRAFRPERKAGTHRSAPNQSERTSIPALRITADAATWKRSRQHLTLQDGDPRPLAVNIYDSATDDLNLARALLRAFDGDDAAIPRSTSFTGGPGTAVRTVRTLSGRGGPTVTAMWHWDDGKRAVLMTVFDVQPDRFAAAEAELDRLAADIRIGSD